MSERIPTARSLRVTGFAPFLAARPALRRVLRTAVALSGPSSSSVLRTLFAACPASRGSRRLRSALPLRGVLALGASHPFWRPAPLCVAGFGLRFPLRGVWVARCFAPFLAARPALRRRLRTALLPLRGVLALGASHPFGGPHCVAGFELRFRCAACSSPRCFAPLFWQTETPDRSPGRDDSVLVSLF